jgi:hypothetical protein
MMYFGSGVHLQQPSLLFYSGCNISSVTALLPFEIDCFLFPSLICPVVAMDPVELRLMMVRRGAAVVVVLCTWLLVRLRSQSRPSITYGPLEMSNSRTT